VSSPSFVREPEGIPNRRRNHYDIVTKAHGGTITVDSEVDQFTEKGARDT
jgi:hypothetical protein